MAKNFVQAGDVLTLVAPAGGVTSGVPVQVGKFNVVPAYSAAADEEFEGHTTGVFELQKVAANVIAQGDLVKLKAGVIDATGATNFGIAVTAAGNGDTTVNVKLVQPVA